MDFFRTTTWNSSWKSAIKPFHKKSSGKRKLWYFFYWNQCIMATTGKLKNWCKPNYEQLLYLFKVPPRKIVLTGQICRPHILRKSGWSTYLTGRTSHLDPYHDKDRYFNLHGIITGERSNSYLALVLFKPFMITQLSLLPSHHQKN